MNSDNQKEEDIFGLCIHYQYLLVTEQSWKRLAVHRDQGLITSSGKALIVTASFTRFSQYFLCDTPGLVLLLSHPGAQGTLWFCFWQTCKKSHSTQQDLNQNQALSNNSRYHNYRRSLSERRDVCNWRLELIKLIFVKKIWAHKSDFMTGSLTLVVQTWLGAEDPKSPLSMTSYSITK